VNKVANWLGKELTLNIEKVAHGGIFVARHEGRVIFVSHTLPGEKVRARVFEDKGGSFARAETVEVLEASPHRVKHVWKAAADGAVGGAEFGHIDLNYQLELKADVLEEALSRMAGITMRPVVEQAPGDDLANGLGYRTRVQLHVDELGNVGPYRERTHQVVEVRDLPLAVEDIRELGLHLKNWSGVRKIEIASSNTGNIQYSVDKKVKGDERLVERAGGRTFRITGGGFWQVHRKAADILTSAVNEAISKAGFDKTADNLDLYGGVGLFAGTIAAKFGVDSVITTVEAFKTATEDAKLNLADLPNVRAILAPTERFLDERVSSHVKNGSPETTATVILDPPRAGAGAKVVGQVLALKPKHIVYVACDPIALARDLKPLTEGGYELASLRAFDLFPHTHHVEAVASLIRK
jgi:tRNA/tmRNA/rRNA uracil-C5-methylase (TrmA/RlmC/RlmD family)